MRKKILILFLFLMMGTGYFNNNSSYAGENLDFFKEIVRISEGKVMEYGVRASFDITEEKEAYCLELLQKLKVSSSEINIVKDEKFYSIEFDNNDLKGYIESTGYDNHNVVTVNIVQSDSEDRLSELKDKVTTAIGKDEKEIKFFDYLKARINNDDKAQVNREIAELLKNNNASNIDTIEIDNGFSTVAYTKRYPVMKNNGKWMDLNYAVCSYASGNYIIIGTPVIITTY
jgi:hypothetical protein